MSLIRPLIQPLETRSAFGRVVRNPLLKGGKRISFLNGFLPPQATFTRSTTGTRFTQSGVNENIAINGIRSDYNPVSLAPLGSLIETPRTNSIRNSSMVGIVAGTPGTLPTNWINFLGGGLAQQIVGTGTERGMPYIDWRIFGTTSSANTSSISFDTTTGITAATGQVWTNSFWISLVGGSLANISSSNMRIIERDAAGTTLVSGTQNILSSITSTATKQVYTRTLVNAGTLRVTPGFDINYTAVGVAIDATFRIYGMQMEIGSWASSFIPTTSAAITRTQDVLTFSSLASIGMNANEGTVIVEGFIYQGLLTTSGQRLIELSDGSGNNRMGIGVLSGGALGGYIVVGGITQGSTMTGVASPSTMTRYKAAFAFKNGNNATCMNGGTVAANTATTMPTPDRLTIGGSGSFSSTNQMNGWVEAITCLPYRLPNNALQALTR